MSVESRHSPASGNEMVVGCTMVAPYVLALDATRIVSIEEDVDGPVVDLTRLFAAEGDARAGAARRVMRVQAGGGEIPVALAEALWLERIAAGDVQPLPRFLDGLRRLLPLAGVFQRASSYRYMLDVDRLAAELPMT